MKKSLKFLVMVVMVVSVLSSSVFAMENTNKYISSCGAYINTWGDGDISVEFHVFGTDIMDTIGAHRVTVYRMKGETLDSGSDDLVATYWHESYPGLMITDDYFYSNSIRLQVAHGYRYYAVIVYYATLGDGGDDMAYTTKPVWA